MSVPVLAALLLIALAPALPAPGVAPAEVAVGPVPDWVLSHPLPGEAVSPDARDGVSILLSDVQTRVDGPPGLEVFERHAERIVSRAGVDSASRITVSYDPGYESLEMHWVRIHRGAEVLDVLDPSEVRVLQREVGLEAGIYDGFVTATILLPDVRVGDVVDHAVTIRGQNPIFAGRFSDRFWTAGPHPYRRIRYRLLVPRSREVFHRGHLTDAAPRVREHDGWIEITWALRDTPAVLPDSDLPSWYDPYPGVQLTEFAGWDEVAVWGTDLFERAAAGSAGVAELASTFATADRDPRRQLRAALRFVQDEVRYFGIEMGPHSHAPHEPEAVLAQRFGDCKDKSLLLVVLLRELGIDAAPALVDTTSGMHLAEQLPSPMAFDHVVVRAEIDGDVLWMDPTREYQGGPVDGLDLPFAALVLRPGIGQLEVAPAVLPDGPALDVHYDFTTDDLHGPTRLVVTTDATAWAAARIRSYFARASREEIRGDYLEYYSEHLPGLEPVGEPTLEDDREADRVRVVERYRIPEFWVLDEDGDWEAGFRPLEVRERVKSPYTVSRTMPLGLGHPEHVVVAMDAALPLSFHFDDEEVAVDDDAFQFRYSKAFDGPRHLRLRWEYRTLDDSVPVDRVDEYLGHVDEAWDHMVYRLWKADAATGAGRGLLGPRWIPYVLFVVLLTMRMAPRALRGLANRALMGGHAERAARLARWGLEATVPVLGPGRPGAAAYLAYMEAAAGRLEEAEARALDVLRRTASRTGRSVHWAHVNALRTLGSIRQKQDRHEEALDYLERAEQASAALPKLPQRHRQIMRLHLLGARARLGRVEGIRAELEAVEAEARGDRLVLHELLNMRGVLAELEGDVDESRRLRRQLVVRSEELFGPEHLFTEIARDLERGFESRLADGARDVAG